MESSAQSATPVSHAAKPASEATVPDAEQPRWAPFETVHISLNMKQALALRSLPSAPLTSNQNRLPEAGQEGSRQDLDKHIRDLSHSNAELQEQLDEQKMKMKALTEEMNRLRLELDQSKTSKPPARKNPAP